MFIHVKFGTECELTGLALTFNALTFTMVNTVSLTAIVSLVYMRLGHPYLTELHNFKVVNRRTSETFDVAKSF